MLLSLLAFPPFISLPSSIIPLNVYLLSLFIASSLNAQFGSSINFPHVHVTSIQEETQQQSGCFLRGGALQLRNV